MTCIITGCRAILGDEEVGGDLHRVGDCYVFNAIVDRETSEARWTFDREEFNHYRKAIDFSYSVSMYERRGVLVAPIAECVLNDAAKEYIK